MSDDLYTTSARNLKAGDNIRLGDNHFSKILAIQTAENELIVGGPHNKTATGLRIHTLDGNDFLIHPGQIFGVKRDPASSKADQRLIGLDRRPCW
jgi:hypothetical protein